MNIIFIDTSKDIRDKKEQMLYDLFGFYLKKVNKKNIYYLNINTKIVNYKKRKNLCSFFLSKKIKESTTYVVLSKQIECENQIKNILNNSIKNITYVSNQNNLYTNDRKYIDDFIHRNNLKAEKIKILVITDELEVKQINKIEELLKTYKILDVFCTHFSRKLYKDIQKINNNLGTVIEIVDKIPKEYYNILLVFSKEYKVTQTKSSFVLDYNNSDLDIKSNTYLIYQKYKENYYKIFDNLGMDISRYERTKLGKLYIHASGYILDI